MLDRWALELGYHTQMFFTSDIPWWLYLVVSIGVAIVVLVVLNGTKLGQALAVIIVLIGGDVAAYTLGGHTMHAADQREYQRQADAERARLADAFAKNLQLEQARAEQAEANNKTLEKERDDAITAAQNLTVPMDANANPASPSGGEERGIALAGGSPCTLPVDIARRLFRIGQSGSAGSAAKYSGRPQGIRGLLPKGDKLPVAH